MNETKKKKKKKKLKNDYTSDRLLISTNNVKVMRERLTVEQLEFKELKSTFQLPLTDTTDAIPILSKLEDLITSFEVQKSSLDDVFLAINGKVVTDNDGLH